MISPRTPKSPSTLSSALAFSSIASVESVRRSMALRRGEQRERGKLVAALALHDGLRRRLGALLRRDFLGFVLSSISSAWSWRGIGVGLGMRIDQRDGGWIVAQRHDARAPPQQKPEQHRWQQGEMRLDAVEEVIEPAERDEAALFRRLLFVVVVLFSFRFLGGLPGRLCRRLVGFIVRVAAPAETGGEREREERRDADHDRDGESRRT